ncbi:hypothetical protein B0T25DRAFT_557184 [Lasiosphaeria hispida]|uniref:Uncharacterized protein n=1 Tax=Lasiosphaeria hispida TaxID=260671 RepID=A0AAJ0M9Z1_9PEZI|nr:hypothetical protein B0T25DRAFT_557184 [Lasiosphaeria hispida]
MQLKTTLIALLTASAVDAYQVRIGYKRSNADLEFCKPFFKVWNDNWSYVAEKEFTGSGCFYDKFCRTHGCPFQVDGIEIGIRAVEDGGSDLGQRGRGVNGWIYMRMIVRRILGGSVISQGFRC